MMSSLDKDLEEAMYQSVIESSKKSPHRTPKKSPHRTPTKGIKGFRIVPVKGDGACLFRAVSVGFNQGLEKDSPEQTLTAGDLRKRSVKNIVKNWYLFKDAVQVHKEGITRDGYEAIMSLKDEFGDEPEIRSLSDVLEKEIVVHREGSDYTSVYGKQFRDPHAIHIIHKGIHYDALIPLRAARKRTKRRRKKSKRTRGTKGKPKRRRKSNR